MTKPKECLRGRLLLSCPPGFLINMIIEVTHRFSNSLLSVGYPDETFSQVFDRLYVNRPYA